MSDKEAFTAGSIFRKLPADALAIAALEICHRAVPVLGPTLFEKLAVYE